MKLYEELNDAVVRDVVRRLVNLDFDVSQSVVWQMERIQEIGFRTYEDTISEIARITGKSEKELKKLFEDAGTETMRYDNSVYKKAGLTPLPLAQSPAMLQILTAGYRKCKGELKNLTLTTANMSQSLFINACNKAYMKVSSGAFSYTAALQQAIEEIGDSGAWVLYPSGRRDRVDVAVRRAVLTGVSQTCGELQLRQLDDMMWDVVDTTAHMGARASHAVWQGGRFSYKGRNKNYPDFEEATGYGTAGGLMGVNCRHNFYPAVDGSPRMYSQAQLDEWKNHKVTYNGTEYSDREALDMQRAYERGIRATKRKLSGLDEGIKAAKDEGVKKELSDAFAKAGLKLKNQEAALSDFLNQTDFKREHDRTQVLGFDRSLSGKAKAAVKKESMSTYMGSLTKNSGGGIINLNRGADMRIDKFTPCLENVKTGKIEQTSYKLATKEELRKLKNWNFNWADSSLDDTEIYKLTLANDDNIQGLISISDFKRDRAVYINIVESAPHNLGKNKQYNGVGGHLYAIAAKKSVEKGYGGFLFMDAKNIELVEHYRNTLGAVLIGRPHPYRMVIDEEASNKLLKIYTLEGE